MKELDLLRQELLSCDTQLADILMKRFDIVENIMALKEKNKMQILQPEQETFIPVSDGDHYYNRGKGQDREQGDMLPPIGSNKHGSKQRSQ